jgi:branched-chain amino acid transport system ATP-binding protein
MISRWSRFPVWLLPRGVECRHAGIFQQIRQFAVEDGMPVLLVEQNVRAALRIADRAYVMRAGNIILEEDSATELARGSWWDLF